MFASISSFFLGKSQQPNSSYSPTHFGRLPTDILSILFGFLGQNDAKLQFCLCEKTWTDLATKNFPRRLEKYQPTSKGYELYHEVSKIANLCLNLSSLSKLYPSKIEKSKVPYPSNIVLKVEAKTKDELILAFQPFGSMKINFYENSLVELILPVIFDSKDILDFIHSQDWIIEALPCYIHTLLPNSFIIIPTARSYPECIERISKLFPLATIDVKEDNWGSFYTKIIILHSYTPSMPIVYEKIKNESSVETIETMELRSKLISQHST